MRLNDGNVHKILFSLGKLYLDGVQIAGEGIEPAKDVMFEFQVNNQPQVEEPAPKDPSILEINVHDSIKSKSVGPGQS
jgi:hypothetical protein